MKTTALLLLCFIFIFPSCKKVEGTNKKLHVAITNTEHLKDTAQFINKELLKNTSKDTKAFYKAHNFKTVWTNKFNRLSFHDAIQEASNDGLLPSDYNLSILQKYESNKTITKEECAAYDILLTQSFTKLARHLFKGKLNPGSVYYDWALPSKKLNTSMLLSKALTENSITETLNSCRPRHKVYYSLKKSLQFLYSLPDDNYYKPLDKTTVLKLKDSGDVVIAVKSRLVYWKDLDSADASGNMYDHKTMKAVKKFQKRHGIYPDGAVSGRTVAALNIGLKKRKQQIIANLERWRWFAYDFGTKAILINIPDYKLAVIENGKDTIETYKVVVGKPARRTPVLQAELNNLVINPTWTVPPTILKEDLTPSASKDRNYFAEHNMKIYKYSDTIETMPEEWDPEKADHYRYVQGPGENNALGVVKFNFNNRFSVYLHDTNHRNLFKRSQRALSSGCVRVEDPLKLAGYVLDKEDAGWTKEKLDEMIALGETKNVGLKKGTHVYQLYWTAWMDKDGIQFRNDIYNLDKILYSKLRN